MGLSCIFSKDRTETPQLANEWKNITEASFHSISSWF